MPLTPEEPQIHESVPGPRTAPTSSRSASTPRPVPGPPRPAAPRPAPPRAVATVGSTSGHAGTGRQIGPPGPAPANQPVVPAAAAAVPAQRAATTETAQIQLIPAPADGALDAAEEAV